MIEAAVGLPATRDELVEALLALTKSDDERVRLGAIKECLDRGWGKPVQGVDLGVAVEITGITRTIIDPKVIDHGEVRAALRILLGRPVLSLYDKAGRSRLTLEDREPLIGQTLPMTLPIWTKVFRSGRNQPFIR